MKHRVRHNRTNIEPGGDKPIPGRLPHKHRGKYDPLLSGPLSSARYRILSNVPWTERPADCGRIRPRCISRIILQLRSSIWRKAGSWRKPSKVGVFKISTGVKLM